MARCPPRVVPPGKEPKSRSTVPRPPPKSLAGRGQAASSVGGGERQEIASPLLLRKILHSSIDVAERLSYARLSAGIPRGIIKGSCLPGEHNSVGKEILTVQTQTKECKRTGFWDTDVNS